MLDETPILEKAPAARRCTTFFTAPSRWASITPPFLHQTWIPANDGRLPISAFHNIRFSGRASKSPAREITRIAVDLMYGSRAQSLFARRADSISRSSTVFFFVGRSHEADLRKKSNDPRQWSKPPGGEGGGKWAVTGNGPLPVTLERQP